MGELHTYFYNEKHERIASIPGMVSVAKGTMLVLKDNESYIVEDVQLHLADNNPKRVGLMNVDEIGFRVFCKKNA
jgi:hypothetical protein